MCRERCTPSEAAQASAQCALPDRDMRTHSQSPNNSGNKPVCSVPSYQDLATKLVRFLAKNAEFVIAHLSSILVHGLLRRVVSNSWDDDLPNLPRTPMTLAICSTPQSIAAHLMDARRSGRRDVAPLRAGDTPTWRRPKALQARHAALHHRGLHSA